MGTPAKERNRLSRERKRGAGLIRTEVIVPEAKLEQLRAFAAQLRQEEQPESTEHA
jgi:hypothetical protein